ALRTPANDDYQQIQVKTKPRKSRKKAKESGAESNAADVIEMDSIPPLPSRN
ncbi:hypothetical protein NFI96_033401, partial [Prochilodus magdalenae]